MLLLINTQWIIPQKKSHHFVLVINMIEEENEAEMLLWHSTNYKDADTDSKITQSV